MAEMKKSIKFLVKEIKEEWFSTITDLYSLASISAYETAWLAMIPYPKNTSLPMFPNCLDWVLHNQQELGYWGEAKQCNQPNIECLSITLVCMVALKTWNVGFNLIEKGLGFVHANIQKLLSEENGGVPQWFAIDFPTLIELAKERGLELFLEGSTDVANSILSERQSVFQSEDGSLFQSPSAKLLALMATNNPNYQVYLESMVDRYGCRASPMYPLDEDTMKLCMVDRVERLGLAEYFVEEIQDALAQIYRKWMDQDHKTVRNKLSTSQIVKDALAFRLLRMHGYRVSPCRFCWFLDHKDLLAEMEENYEYFLRTMLIVYQASNLMFLGEMELEKAKSFSRKILEREISGRNQNYNVFPVTNLQTEIERELSLPWFARLDHLAHREYIEGIETIDMQIQRETSHRLCCLNSNKLLQLAKENFLSRQSMFKSELEELKRWAKDSGICDLGFGREKTTYCYFAMSTTEYHPHLFDVRMTCAKSGALIAIIDDFFDMKGSMEELKSITDAIKRWDGEALHGHGKVLFEAVVNLVKDISRKVFNQHGYDVTKRLQEIWHRTLTSWLIEAQWSRSGYAPSIDEYLYVGKTSVGVEAIVLPAMYILAQGFSEDMVNHSHYKVIASLLMVSCRVLNDRKSYEKEMEEGAPNLIRLYLSEHPDAKVDDAVVYMTEMVEKKKKELLEHVLMDDVNCILKSCKKLHLSILKAFQMFYNSTNGFDSPTEMLESIHKAIYKPIEIHAYPQGFHGSKTRNISGSHVAKVSG